MGVLEYLASVLRGWFENLRGFVSNASADNLLFDWIITVLNFVTLQLSNLLGFGKPREQFYGVISFASFAAFLIFSPSAFVAWLLLLSPFAVLAVIRAIPPVNERWPLPEQDWKLFDG